MNKRTALKYIAFFAAGLMLVLYLGCFAVLNFGGFDRLSMSDMYEDTLVARLMWEKGTLFPDNYVFGNQFYVAATPNAASLFYGLTGSPNTAMAMATTVMGALTLFTLAWMLWPFVKHRSAILGALLVMVSCTYSPLITGYEPGQLFFILCSYYACYAITLFVVLGDYMRALRAPGRRAGTLVTALLLSFAMGMQSLRQTCVMVLPLLLFELVRLVACRVRTGAPLLSQKRVTLRVLSYAAANLLGCAVIRIIAPPQETIYGGQSVLTGASFAGKLQDCYLALREITGYDIASGGFGRVYPLLFVFFTLLLLTAAVRMLRTVRDFDGGAAPCWWLLLLGIAAVLAASVFTSVRVRGIYLFPYYPLLAVSFALVADRCTLPRSSLLTVVLCVLAALNLHFSYGQSVQVVLREDTSVYRQMCDRATELGVRYVYASHSDAAPNVAVRSDGALIAGGWLDEIIFRVTPYINIQDIYSLEDYADAVFVFQDDELPLAEIETAGNGAKLTVVGVFGDYTMCTSSQQLMYPLTWH